MKLGLKLWSINTDFYYEEARKLYNQGYFDYIELYVVPDTLTTLEKWKKLDIPFLLHAPHFMHKVNLADNNKFAYNKEIYAQVETFRQELNAEYTIIHSGMNGTIDETIRQLQLINPKNFLIENKPYLPPLIPDYQCVGSTTTQIQKALTELSCGFCLDIGHALCTANSLNLEPYGYLAEFQQLNPQMYHLSDGIINSPLDQHLHFREGNYNIKKIFSMIDINSKISIETKKNSKENLDDFIKDIQWIHAISEKLL